MNDKKREQQRPQPDSERKPDRRDHTAVEEEIRKGQVIRDTYKPPPPKDDSDQSD